jgi:hypothetical protein
MLIGPANAPRHQLRAQLLLGAANGSMDNLHGYANGVAIRSPCEEARSAAQRQLLRRDDPTICPLGLTRTVC